MKSYYAMLFMGAAILILVCFIISRRSKRPLSSYSEKIFLAIFMAVFSQMAIVSTSRVSIGLFFFSVFFTSIDWILFFLYEYFGVVTDHYKKNGRTYLFLLTVSILDSILMLSNNFTGFVFSVYKLRATDGETYLRSIHYIPYNIHLILCYLLAAYIFVMFVRKMALTPKVYWPRYYPLGLVFVVLLVWDATYVFMKAPVDLSILGYAVGSIFLVYFSSYYSSSRIVEKMLSRVANDMDDILVIFDIDNNCIFYNTPAQHTFEITNSSEVIPELFQPEADDYVIWSNNGTDYKYSRYFKTKIGEFWMEVRFVTINLGKKKLGSYYHVLNRDIEHKRLVSEQYLTHHDKLTGLYNLSGLYSESEKLLRDNPDEKYVIAVSDIRGFKFINEMYGKESADDILVNIADHFRELMPENCVYGRLGGDRFGIMVRQAEMSTAFIDRLFMLHGNYDTVAESRVIQHVGIYSIEDRTIPVSVMYDRAVLAIGRVKEDYENRVGIYDEEMRKNQIWAQEITIEADMAIQNNEFIPFLQAQFDNNGHMTGAEVLIRWNRRGEGILPPGRFIGIFESNSLIYRIDRYMWEKTCQILKSWEGTILSDLYLSVNISGKDFYFADLYEEFTGLIDKYKLNPAKLRLEITETVALEDIDEKISIINRLRDAGFIIEMDDFGSGYSSLNVLKDLPLDVLKIDMLFLSKTEDITKEKIIINSIVSLAKNLDLTIISEGVENEEQVLYLKNIGCDIFQGYYFAKPVSLEDFTGFALENLT